MVSSAPLPQLAWHHPPEATRDYLGFLLSTGRAVVVPPLQVELAKQQANEQAARLTPAEWLARLSQWATSSDLHSDPAVTDWAQAALDAALPGWNTQVAARTRPLRDLWQARGPGFLRQLRRQLPPVADAGSPTAWPVLAVHPLSGGHGLLLPGEPAILLEAMLTDADDRLPEILRLGWLVSRRAIEDSLEDAQEDTIENRAASHRPDGISRARRPLAACLLTLLLAQDLEWMPVAPHVFGLALRQWSLVPADEIPPLEDRFLAWWNASETTADWASVRRFLDESPA